MAACVIRDEIKIAVELLQQKHNTDNFYLLEYSWL